MDPAEKMQLEHSDRYSADPVYLLLSKHAECSYPRTLVFGGVELQIEEGVFCPDLTQTSALMLSVLSKLDLASTWRVLDVFTGSGVFALYCASQGCEVVAIDQSRAAVKCALTNVARNNAAKRVDVRIGDGFSSIGTEEVFDLVLASPPLLPGVPSNSLEAAVVDPGLGATIRFLQDLPHHLKSGGRALVLLSDVFERIGYDLSTIIASSKLKHHTVARRDVGYEAYSVYELSHE